MFADASLATDGGTENQESGDVSHKGASDAFDEESESVEQVGTLLNSVEGGNVMEKEFLKQLLLGPSKLEN